MLSVFLPSHLILRSTKMTATGQGGKEEKVKEN